MDITSTTIPVNNRTLGEIHCIVCKEIPQRWFNRMNRDVFRCPACGHIQVPAGLAMTDAGRSIYEAEQSIFEIDGNDEYYMDEGTESAARDKLKFVRKFCFMPDARLLEVGSSYGHFLAEAMKSYDAYGIELNARAVAWSLDHFRVRNHTASLFDLPSGLPKTFHVITAWDVIEHLDDPRAALGIFNSRLVGNGWLFLSSPDAGSLIARFLGKRWYYEDPLQHINLFSRKNLQRMLEESGFILRSVAYFGRQYRIRYILNRLRYFAGDNLIGHAMGALARMPENIARMHITIKLWDVMGLAAQRKS